MSTPATEWKRPPIIEVVLGVQFDAIPELSNGHLGWFWREMLSEFPNSDDVPPIERDIGPFGEVPLGFPALGIRPVTGQARLRMTSADGTKMVQVQNGWLVVNWMKKGDSDYPGFTGVKALFDRTRACFDSFLKSQSLGVIRPNLWEVTYIDHVPMGTVWGSLADLPRVFPGLFGNAQSTNGEAETVDATWTFRLAPRSGRLRLSVQSARTVSEPERDILLVRSVARGPLGADNTDNLDDALNFGRSSVVETFVRLASTEAKEYWIGKPNAHA